MEQFCFLNGEIVPLSNAKVSVYDIGLLRGYGVYDGLAVFNGKPFRFEDHMTRFRNSASALTLAVPHTNEEIREAIGKLLEANSLTNAVVRTILTGGEALAGIDFNPALPTFYILAEPLVPPPPAAYRDGALLITHEYQRYLPEFKTTHYIEAVRMQAERKRRGATEVLYVSDGMVREPSTSNFFAFIGDTLVTPKNAVLGGITRKVVIELAAPHFAVEERDLPLEEALRAGEAFITSSFKQIVPIVRIDDTAIGDGKVGERTNRLIKLFADYSGYSEHLKGV